jgi:hypothetical protein
MWEQLAGAALGGLLSSSGGSQKSTNSPWTPAKPWLKSLIGQGQELQDQYMAEPFSQQQRDAFGNQFGLLDFMMQSAPGIMENYGLLGRGYDRNAENRTQTGFQPMSMQMPSFAPLSAQMGQSQTGLLSPTSSPTLAQTVTSNAQFAQNTQDAEAAQLQEKAQLQRELDEWLRMIGGGA